MKDHKFDRFGFTVIPFINASKTAYLDAARDKVLKNLRNFLNYRGFAVLCGSPGTGKTALLKHLCQQLQPNEHKVIYIPFSMLKPSDMLKNICVKLDIEPTVSTSKMLTKIQDCITEIQPVNPVLVLDEIQKISHQTLEVIRLMTNFNFEEKNIFTVLMAGNDEFIQHLKLRINEPLRQRVTCYCRLEALSRKETQEYITHHFEVVGVHHKIITEQAVAMAYDFTAGIPRLISSLLFAGLEAAAEAESQIIDLEHINRAGKLISPPGQEVYR